MKKGTEICVILEWLSVADARRVLLRSTGLRWAPLLRNKEDLG